MYDTTIKGRDKEMIFEAKLALVGLGIEMIAIIVVVLFLLYDNR